MCGIHQYFIVFLAACVALSLGASISARQKITDMSNTAAPTGSDCEHRTPCAWGVYVPFTRKLDYYMKNTMKPTPELWDQYISTCYVQDWDNWFCQYGCKCPKDTDCTKMDDDISVSAYIYRCVKPDPTAVIREDPFSDFPHKLPDYVTKSS